MARTSIDFTSGLNRAQITDRNDGGHQSAWVKALAELKLGVDNGNGEYGTYYLIGTFLNSAGAQTAIRGLSDRDDLPGLFELESVIKDVRDDDGNLVYVEAKDKKTGKMKQVVKRTSELWAAVVQDDDDETGDPGDPDDENEDDDTTDEPPAKPAGRGASRRRSAA